MKRWLSILGFMTLFLIVSIIATQSMDQSEQKYSKMERYENLFDDQIKHEFKIYMSKDEWLGMGEDILTALETDGYGRTGNYRTADIVYEDNYGSIFYENVGIRTKGNTSRVLPEDEDGNVQRANFKIKFDYDDHSDTDYEKRDLFTLNELNLKSQMNDDTTYIREDYAYDLMNTFDVITSRSSFAVVKFYIEGELYDFGVYTMIEPINKSFLKKRYTALEGDGNLYKCLWQNFGPATLSIISNRNAVGIKNWLWGYRPSYDLQTNTNSYNTDDIRDFAYNLTTKNNEAFEKYIQKTFEVDDFLKTTALNIALGMPDDYWAMGNNYFLYFNPLGKIEFYPYDYDNSLGAGWDGMHFGGYEGIATADIFEWHDTASDLMGTNYSRPLIEKILKVERYQRTYLKYYEEILKHEYFTSEYFEKKMNRFYDVYKDDLYNMVDGNVTLDLGNIKWYFETKRESIQEQLK